MKSNIVVFFRFFTISFVIIVLVRFFYLLTTLVMFRKRLYNFGKKIAWDSGLTAKEKKTFAAGILTAALMVIISVGLMVLTKEKLCTLVIVYSFMLLFRILSSQKRALHSGIYERGILAGEFMEWEKIRSFSQIDRQNLKLNLENGDIVSLHISENIDEGIMLMAENHIPNSWEAQ